METIYVFTSLATIFVTGMGVWAMRIKGRLDRWEIVAKSLGLEFDEEAITGRLDGFHLAVSIEELRVIQSITSRFLRFLSMGTSRLGSQFKKRGFWGKSPIFWGPRIFSWACRTSTRSWRLRRKTPMRCVIGFSVKTWPRDCASCRS